MLWKTPVRKNSLIQFAVINFVDAEIMIPSFQASMLTNEELDLNPSWI
jgi:hypothetical protein